jgi:hypothetical protein
VGLLLEEPLLPEVSGLAAVLPPDEPLVLPELLGPAAGLPEGPGLPAVLPLVLGAAPAVLPEVLPLELGLAPIEEELLLESVELGVELEVGGVVLPLGVELAPPEVCAIAMPPATRAAAVARVVRTFLLLVMSCSFTGNPEGIG